MTRTFRALLAVLAPVALVFGAVAAPAAFAVATSTVSGRVIDESGDPIRGVQVWVTTDGDNYDYLDGTNALGEYSTPHGMKHQSGQTNLVYWDSARQFAGDSDEVVLASGTNNAIPDKVLASGATVTGTVKAPSGAPLKNVKVVIADNDSPIDPDYVEVNTAEDGTYVARPLGIGDFYVLLGTDGYSTHRLNVNIPDANAIANPDITTKAPVSASFTGSSPSKGKVTLKVTVSAAYYGLTAIGYGGRFHVYDGSKTVKAWVTISSSGKATITIGNLKKGSHKFKVKFLGAFNTLAKTSSVKSVTVK